MGGLYATRWVPEWYMAGVPGTPLPPSHPRPRPGGPREAAEARRLGRRASSTDDEQRPKARDERIAPVNRPPERRPEAGNRAVHGGYPAGGAGPGHTGLAPSVIPPASIVASFPRGFLRILSGKLSSPLKRNLGNGGPARASVLRFP